MPWYDYLERDEYQRIFERDKFERETEPPEDFMAKAYERFRGVEQQLQPAMPEPEPLAYRTVWAGAKERKAREAEYAAEAEARAVTYRDPTTGEEISVTPPFDPREKSQEEINKWLQSYLTGQAKSRAGWSLPMAMFMAATESVIPEKVTEPIGRIPVAGPKAEEFIRATTGPATLPLTLAWPGITARMGAYGVAGWTAGKGLEEAGVPTAEVGPITVGPAGVLETAGFIGGPAVGPMAERAALRGVKAAPAAARAEVERLIPTARRVLTEELGGPKLRPKYILTDDIRSLAEINKRLGQLSRVEKMTAKQTKERAQLLAEKDLHELRATGTVDDQMDNLLDDILEMEKELELKAVAREVKPARAPQFGTPERVEWEAARAGKPRGVRPTTRYSGEPADFLRERLKVYKQFRDEMKIVPAGEEAVEEALVTRARFTERGEVIEEPTFATEAELAGIRPVQAELGIAAGERPIETAGPMFKAAPEAARAVDPRGDLALREALAEELFAARGTRMMGPDSKALHVLHYADDRPKLEKIARRFGYEVEITDLPDVTYIKALGMGRITPERVPARPAAPKPAAQAFREATEIRPAALEEAPAWELAGMGRAEALEAPELARAGVRAPGRAGAPPPPRKPPVAEAVPPIGAEDPVPKLIQLIKKAKPVRRETELLKTEARRKQAAAMGRIFERYPEEAPYRAKGVLKGELPRAAFEPPINALSEAEVGQLRRQIRSFFEREGGRAFDELSVRDALEGILGGKQPTWGEIGQLQAVFGRKLGAALEGKMPTLKRVAREALEIWNLGRTFKASLDQSWHLRQGIRFVARHPKESVRQGLRGMRALWSQQTYEDSVRFIVRGQEEGRMSRNLFVGRVGPGATTVERTEAYISKYSDVIPGIKHTAREYAASGNFVRGGINENMNRTWTQRLGRKLTEEEMEWTGRVCNWGLGRGPLPDEFRGLLAAVWFAPGYRTAGPAYFSLLVNPKTPGFVRRMVAEEVVAWIGSGVALMTALELSGVADVEGIDLRHPGRVSSDFGKIRVGKMRFDIWGGSQQQARAILGLITGERKTLSTGEIMDISRREVASRYIESGYQPSMGLATSIWTGKDWEGKPISLPGAVQDLLAPMAAQDIVEAVREEGAKGWIAAPFAHFGVGVWTPDLAGVRVNELTQRYDAEGRHKNQMSAVEFERLAEEHPDLAKARQDQLNEAALRGSDWAKFTLKREEADAEFERGLKDALLDPRGRTWEQMGRELDDHLYEWAIRSDEFYGELDIDPRGDLDRRINAYYAIEMPALATEEERSAFFRQREEMLRDDPDLAAAIHDHKVLRFTDPDVRRFVDLKWQADLVANEYYSIPYKSRMPAEQQEQVSQYVRQAEAIARMQNVSFRRALMQTSISQELIGLAMRYKRLPTNKARERYWRQHPESEELYRTFYGPIPLEIPVEAEPEMAMAGVP